MYIRKKRSADDQAVKSIQIQATLVKVCQRRLSCIHVVNVLMQEWAAITQLVLLMWNYYLVWGCR